MRLGRMAPDLLTPISTAASVEEGLAETLGRVVRLSGAAAGALAFRPRREPPIVVAGGTRRTPGALRRWLVTLAATPARGRRGVRVVPPVGSRGRPAALLRMPLGAPGRRVGELVLLGRPGRPRPVALSRPVSRELGKAIDRVWRLEDLRRDPRAAGSRAAFAASGYRAVALVPLATGGAVFGAVTLASARPAAFDDADLEAIAEIARPLAASIERRRFSDESRRRA